MTLQQIEAREKAKKSVRQAMHELDRALDCLAADKDLEAWNWVGMARADVESALLTVNAHKLNEHG